MFDFDDLDESLPYEGEVESVGDRAGTAVKGDAPKTVVAAVADPQADGFEQLRRASGADRPQMGAAEEAAFRKRSADEVLRHIADPWALLGLKDTATSMEVRRAYHRLALLHHPDKAGDSEAFRAINEAYHALTNAKTNEGGWKDLDGKALGPWRAHNGKISTIIFDVFGAPPWEGRRLYTGCWDEGSVKCWELSEGIVGKSRPPPRLIGEIAVGGFVNQIAALSPQGLLTAQSAGMKPMAGESLRAWDLGKTPFKLAARKKDLALEDKAASRVGPRTQPKQVGDSSELALRDDADGGQPVPKADEGHLQQSQMVYLHHRGVRAISLWPRPVDRNAVPLMAGTVSKDWLGLSKIGMDGTSLDQPAIWKRPTPHGGIGDVNALVHETAGRMWTGGNDGVVKCWDVTATASEVMSITASDKSWITAVELWPSPGVLVATHSSGISYVDIRAGKLIRQNYTKNPANAVCLPHGSHTHLLAAIGTSLYQYDTRLFADGPDTKPQAVGEWDLRAPVLSVSCTETARGNLLAAVGTEDGRVAVFDTS